MIDEKKLKELLHKALFRVDEKIAHDWGCPCNNRTPPSWNGCTCWIQEALAVLFDPILLIEEYVPENIPCQTCGCARKIHCGKIKNEAGDGLDLVCCRCDCSCLKYIERIQ